MINNKKQGIGIIIFFAVLFLTIIIGFVGAFLWAVLDFASDEITPIIDEIGMVGDANVTEAASYTVAVTNTLVGSLNWILAILYILALVFTLVFAFLSGSNPHPAYIPLFLAFMILLIFGCVIFSNMYLDMYTGTDEIATRLQEQTVTSFLILHSPYVMAMIAVIGGVFMFTRQANSEGSPGGFGI